MKNRRYRLIPAILLLVIIVIAVTSCGSSTSIVGRWQPLMEEDQYMEFFSDGRIELVDENTTLTGTYELQEGNQIRIAITGMFEGPEGEYGIAIATYEIQDDVLTLTQGDAITKFKRAD